MRKSMPGLALAIATTLVAPAQADIVSLWDFNSPVADANTSTGNLLPALGGGTAATLGGVTASFSAGTGSSDPAGSDDSGWNTTTYASQGGGDKSRGVQFNVSTVGLKDIVLTYDLRHSNTSSRYELLQYSLDGINFTDFATFDGDAGDTWFNGRSVDLSGIAGVNDNASFAFRVVATFAPGTGAYSSSNDGSNYATNGTWRFDMVSVSAAPVPEPETYALMLAGLGVVGLAVRRRSRT
ncbi:MAG TPA: PEPxxWA-CTERM sorting domain-containing protein [Thiobacillaceae bacterium]|nr:PEPxxWA-CTERM sorting domain-containing protein [Thiobacillaceae bacterium]